MKCLLREKKLVREFLKLRDTLYPHLKVNPLRLNNNQSNIEFYFYLFTPPSIYVSVYLSTLYLSIYLSIYLSYLSIHRPLHLYLSISLSSIYQPIFPLLRLFLSWIIHLSIHLSFMIHWSMILLLLLVICILMLFLIHTFVSEGTSPCSVAKQCHQNCPLHLVVPLLLVDLLFLKLVKPVHPVSNLNHNVHLHQNIQRQEKPQLQQFLHLVFQIFNLDNISLT